MIFLHFELKTIFKFVLINFSRAKKKPSALHWAFIIYGQQLVFGLLVGFLF